MKTNDYKEVILSTYELHLAAQVGIMRNIQAMRHSDAQSFSKEGNWTIHVEGSAGEMACAQALGCYWSGSFNTYKTVSDLGDRREVRTRTNHDHDLIIRDNDPDDCRFYLVTGRTPYFRVHGWILGSDAKSDEFRKDFGGHGPAYFVPKDRLHSLSETMESVGAP